ncbi:FkbM family methyltransferase [Chryseotalea sanaruensis]|uniref:FkbM family methyltransferase n=1 Tax=Chryseotalea sanaruensis TaxID=2482724 RepID=A0A401UBY3_9BACT|nr:FkbM family methyltransferase [Chryseotalea sanaruensis]GCC52399.1 FkbM family methyltransferase [Chryseotalea sanaruensis]
MILTGFKKFYKQLLFDLNANSKFYGAIYKIYLKHFYKPSKDSLAVLIDEFSKKRGKVKFIQIGANDGFYHDPLYKFIKRDAWEGVLLEPQPYVFETFLKRLHKNNPAIHLVNAALDYNDGERKIYRIAFSNSRWATGLSTLDKSVLEKVIASGHIDRLAKRYGEKIPASINEYISDEPINCMSVDTLMSKYSMTQLDWLQIDAEGYDYEIIKMFNIEKTQPSVIAYESSHLSAEDKSACEAYLIKNGYTLQQIKENTVAQKNTIQ